MGVRGGCFEREGVHGEWWVYGFESALILAVRFVSLYRWSVSPSTVNAFYSSQRNQISESVMLVSVQ